MYCAIEAEAQTIRSARGILITNVGLVLDQMGHERVVRRQTSVFTLLNKRNRVLIACGLHSQTLLPRQRNPGVINVSF